MSKISKDQVKHVANLARLSITEQEAEKYSEQLSAIIDFSELLNELDTSNVEPTTHVLEMKNIVRKDEPKEWISKDDALKNAPDQKDGQFRVPSILDS
ncbi:Asp-tRNA(Asn)/Glu-tRNA(Gln) amidotransferase subunit GatC [Alkalibacillus haloalkaliphilus]|uniref:Asp-tRNA(Asn)/Glu-tRNA(Gln) amidotransferase subunit GatC n=1 Tax=Alkalibacillus haloalkaliphilus TaxID=94136 RepID=UPI0029368E59|nr:Asp-tRNA(Asn)/Glu-tRNA(Gln) amidotransferase subunit GatC [Alkalibacillus haloalkaliphilus]MDV2581734.1 Asp-tRNA(Asn)/Glu-tRNA(Gln) amidotransferase subunit GatC [Alkalibacillus haloalkaliphilus]